MHDNLIFIVEEDSDLLELLLLSLPRFGLFRVVGASKSDEALLHLQQVSPDGVLVDFRRPLKSRQFLHDLRSNPLTAQIPLFILADRVEDRDLFVSFAAESDRILMKPVFPSDLAQTIQQALARTTSE